MSYKDKEKQKQANLKWYNKNKEKRLEVAREWKRKNKDRCKEYGKIYKKEHPWERFLKHIKSRCNILTHKTYKYYGGKGIKCLITMSDLKKLWFRDKAYNLKRPSIDRKDTNKDYTYDNCRFIEFSRNCDWRHNI